MKNLWLLLLLFSSVFGYGQSFRGAGESLKEALQDGFRTYLDQVVGNYFPEDLIAIQLLRDKMLQDPYPYVTEYKQKRDEHSHRIGVTMTIERPKILGEIAAVNARAKLFPYAAAVVYRHPSHAQSAASLEELLCRYGFSVVNLSPASHLRYWDMREKAHSNLPAQLSAWLADTRAQIVIEMTAPTAGKAYNLAGRLFASFDGEGNWQWQAVEKIFTAAVKWRTALECFLTFNQFPQDERRKLEKGLENLQSILDFHVVAASENRLVIDVISRSPRNSLPLLEAHLLAPLDGKYDKEGRGHEWVYTYTGTTGMRAWALWGGSSVLAIVLVSLCLMQKRTKCCLKATPATNQTSTALQKNQCEERAPMSQSQNNLKVGGGPIFASGDVRIEQKSNGKAATMKVNPDGIVGKNVVITQNLGPEGHEEKKTSGGKHEFPNELEEQ